MRRCDVKGWLIGLIGFVIGSAFSSASNFGEQQFIRKVFTDPYPSGAARPLWLVPSNCRTGTRKDVREQDAAMRTVENFPDAPRHLIADTALGVLTQPWAPIARVFKDVGLLCPPLHLTDRMMAAAESNQIFIRAARLDENGLRLARAVGPRKPEIVRAVANTAFNEHVMPNNAEISDTRPFARLILAEFGRAAAPWVKRASAEMGDDSELGVGAAQIAATTGDPKILAYIERLMNERLSKVRKDKVISITERDRLYALAYALGMAGQKASPYTSGVAELLSRKVGSAAPPFGTLSVEPRRMCWLSERVGGVAAKAAKTKQFCQDRYALSEA